MSILDEIKKVSDTTYTTYSNLREIFINDKPDTNEKYAKLSDIEKILGEMKCEKCKHLKNCSSKITGTRKCNN